MITVTQYRQFLDKLAADQKSANALLLTEWEQCFLNSYLNSNNKGFWFTEARRKSTDRIWLRYGPQIDFPHPTDLVVERPQIPPADPTGCEYLVRVDTVQRRCNQPAEFQMPGRLRYCNTHAAAVEKAFAHTGKIVRFVKFSPS